MPSRLIRKVRVHRNQYGVDRDEHPWLVTCEHCADDDNFLAALMGSGTKGWAAEWRTAQDYAIRHAMAHEARRCPHCLNVPGGPLPEEASSCP